MARTRVEEGVRQVCDLSGWRAVMRHCSGSCGESRFEDLFDFQSSSSPRRWHGRPLRPSFEAGNQPWKAPNLRRRCHEPCFGHEHRFKLFHRLHRERLGVVLFLLLTFFHCKAQRAGMLAIEGLFHRLGHADLIEVRKEHARPRHALQNSPVHAQREAHE